MLIKIIKTKTCIAENNKYLPMNQIQLIQSRLMWLKKHHCCINQRFHYMWHPIVLTSLFTGGSTCDARVSFKLRCEIMFDNRKYFNYSFTIICSFSFKTQIDLLYLILQFDRNYLFFAICWLSRVGIVKHPASGGEWYKVHLAGWTSVISMFVYRSQSTLLAR